MEQENKKVISIRLIYVILFFAIIGITVFGIKYYNNQKTQKIAESSIEVSEEENINIATRAETNITSRSEELSRDNEETVESEEQISSEQEIANTENEDSENEITQNQEEQKDDEQVKEESAQEEVAETTAQEVPEAKYKQISEVKISKNMDLTVRTGLSREDFIKLISGVKQDTSGFFEENAGLIYDLCEQYSLNEIFFCGVISAESGWNIASNHRSTHNYISLMTKGKLIRFASVEEGLTEAAKKLHTNYLTPGGKFYYGKTLAAVKTKFCPASSTWVDLVYGRMSQIVK